MEAWSPRLPLSAQSLALVSSLRIEKLDSHCLPAAGRVSVVCVHVHMCLSVSSEDHHQVRGCWSPPIRPNRVFMCSLERGLLSR